VVEYTYIHTYIDKEEKKTNNLYVHNICVNVSCIEEDDIIDYRLEK
jgi:ribosomal protein S17